MALIYRFGIFQFTVLPLGLTNAPATFQHLTNSILFDFLNYFLTVYSDNLLVYNASMSEHLAHLWTAFENLDAH